MYKCTKTLLSHERSNSRVASRGTPVVLSAILARTFNKLPLFPSRLTTYCCCSYSLFLSLSLLFSLSFSLSLALYSRQVSRRSCNELTLTNRCDLRNSSFSWSSRLQQLRRVDESSRIRIESLSTFRSMCVCRLTEQGIRRRRTERLRLLCTELIIDETHIAREDATFVLTSLIGETLNAKVFIVFPTLFFFTSHTKSVPITTCISRFIS